MKIRTRATLVDFIIEHTTNEQGIELDLYYPKCIIYNEDKDDEDIIVSNHPFMVSSEEDSNDQIDSMKGDEVIIEYDEDNIKEFVILEKDIKGITGLNIGLICLLILIIMMVISMFSKLPSESRKDLLSPTNIIKEGGFYEN